jgi:hypothetical protein
MKTRDLFAGCSVTITPHDDVWLVSLTTDDVTSLNMRMYHNLPDAVEAAHEWLLMLSDETEIRIDVEAHKRVARLMQEALARHALGEEIVQPKMLEEVVERDTLRSWFEREMG